MSTIAIIILSILGGYHGFKAFIKLWKLTSLEDKTGKDYMKEFKDLPLPMELIIRAMVSVSYIAGMLTAVLFIIITK